MNANELADKWNAQGFSEYELERECGNQMANMLRQQADRIRNLEKTLGFKNSGYETINLTPPVAWINLDRFNDEALYLADCVSETKVDNMGIITPLYTHPVKEQDESFDRTASHMAGEYVSYPVKELTDEVWSKAFDFYCETDEGVLKFDLELRDEWKKEQLIRWKEALRKAQEK